jgi:hypothetical protein
MDIYFKEALVEVAQRLSEQLSTLASLLYLHRDIIFLIAAPNTHMCGDMGKVIKQ